MLSIITPFYKGSEHLYKMKRISKWAELNPSVEYIVVDDGTPEIDLNYKSLSEHLGISCIRQENSGPAAARKKGLEYSRGDFIYFLDCDDMPDLSLMDKLVCDIGLQKYSKNDMIVISDQDGYLSRYKAVFFLIAGVFNIKIAPSSVVVSRDIVSSTQFFSLSWGEDIPWLLGMIYQSNRIVLMGGDVERYFSDDTRGVSYSFKQVCVLTKTIFNFSSIGFFGKTLSLIVFFRFFLSYLVKKVKL